MGRRAGPGVGEAGTWGARRPGEPDGTVGGVGEDLAAVLAPPRDVGADDDLPGVGLAVSVTQAAPAGGDLGEGVLDEVLGPVVVAGDQDGGTQQRELAITRPARERRLRLLLHVP